MTERSPESDPRILELYKIAVEMADRVSARRSTANTFFLTVQTAFVAVLGVATPSLQKAPWWTALAVTLAGIILSASWSGLRTKSFPLFRWCFGETGGMRAAGIPVPAVGAAGLADAGF